MTKNIYIYSKLQTAALQHFTRFCFSRATGGLSFAFACANPNPMRPAL